MGSIRLGKTGVKLTKITEPSSKLSTCSIGDITEYKAVIWLIENNFKVFKNSECTGPIDLIAISDTGEIKFIDVKTNYKPKKRSEIQKELGVVALRPSAKGGFHFIKHHKK